MLIVFRCIDIMLSNKCNINNFEGGQKSDKQWYHFPLRQCLGQTLHSLGKIQCFHDFSSYEKNRFAKYFEPVKNSENQYLPHIKKR